MKKYLGSFFSSLFAMALGIGLSSSCVYEREPQRWQEPVEPLSFTDGVVTLGRYPQTLTDLEPNTVKSLGTLDDETGWYTYNQKQYAISPVKIDSEYASAAKWNNGSNASNLDNVEKVFLVEPIKWEVLSSSGSCVDIISTRIIERWQFTWSGDNVEFKRSDLYKFLTGDFYKRAFDDTDKSYLQSYDSETPSYFELPEAGVLRGYADEKAEYPSDYAIASNLSGNPARGGETYVNGPYWTKTVVGDRITVYWTKKGTTDCLPTDPKIGVRPLIRIESKGSGGTGISTVDPSSPSKSSRRGGGGNATLVVGIVFMVVGAGGLIGFFVYWSKKHKDGKPPIWLIASIGCCLIISVVGIGCFSGGVSGGNTVVGWYQGNNYDCVEFGERLAINLTADGKVYRYVADAWLDSAVNYEFVRQEGVGEWSYSGGKLTIYAAPEWHRSSWEQLEMTYNDCNGLGSFLHYEGYVGTAYQWYHYSRVDSEGINKIRNADTHESGNINFGLRGF